MQPIRLARNLLLLPFLIGLVALLATATDVFAAPVAQGQEQRQVYALPGKLRKAQNQPFGNYLVATDGQQYGIVGRTPDVEAEIETYREIGPDTIVKVWGLLYAGVDVPEIVVSDIQLDDPTLLPSTSPSVPAAPRVTVIYPTVNVRSGPDTSYPAVGGLGTGDSCPITGRDANSLWWLIRCDNGVIGWIFGGVVSASGNTASVPVVAVGPPPPTATPAPAAPVPTNTPADFVGWSASYFANRDLAGSPVLVQDVPDINFNWGTGSPGGGVPVDNFSARYERVLGFNGGNFEFVLRVDDGARVWVNNELIIDSWQEGSIREGRATRTLSGNLPVRVEYFEATGNASVQLVISQVGSATQLPSQPASPDDWEAAYFNNTDLAGNPVLSRYEGRSPYPLDYNWGSGSPAPGTVSNDNWSARWRGRYYFDPGDYTFRIVSDDGVRVFIDGQRIIDEWRDGYKERSNRFLGLGGGTHEITVEFYERSGNAQVRVWWYKDNQTESGGRHRDE